jgi:hypothetical protein
VHARRRPEAGFAGREASCGVLCAAQEEGVRRGNRGSPAYGFRSRYGYIFLSRLNGISDVAEASCG